MGAVGVGLYCLQQPGSVAGHEAVGVPGDEGILLDGSLEDSHVQVSAGGWNVCQGWDEKRGVGVSMLQGRLPWGWCSGTLDVVFFLQL